MHFGTPHPFFLLQSVCFVEDRNVAYLNNAKAGCSTIREALILGQRADADRVDDAPLTANEVHGRHPAWSAAIDRIGPSSRVFTVVRNPFARLLSAYLDKIARKNSIRFQYLVARRMPLTTEVSFLDFLRALDRDPHRAVSDQHYRAQVENIHLGSVAPTRIHYLENFHLTAGALCDWLDWDLPFALRDGHGTGAGAKIARFYDDEAVDIVRRIHADDFRAFGYSTDPADATEAPQDSMDHEAIDPVARRAVDLATARLGSGRAALMARLGDAAPSLTERLLMAEGPGAPAAETDALMAEIRAALPRLVGSVRAMALIALARMAARAGDHAEAAQALQLLLVICPYLSGERFRLAQHRIAMGQLDLARAQRFALQHGSWRKDLVQQLREMLGEDAIAPTQG